ncbi:MAG: hypothetical protein M3340_03285 [Actinomycetota bacterium]|nr:hypothetical protein [Actinomycetota bacterium]
MIVLLGVVTSILGSAVWEAIAPESERAFTWIVERVESVSPLFAIAAAAPVASVALVVATDRFLEPALSRRYAANFVEVFLCMSVMLILVAAPVGLLASGQVVTGSEVGGPVFEVLAYIPAGAAAAGVLSLVWWPVTMTIWALGDRVAELEKKLDGAES